jgi:hypothetical protein
MLMLGAENHHLLVYSCAISPYGYRYLIPNVSEAAIFRLHS